tara:strand:- start:160 stop:507 length:348 start_codon:yes stop_codon:yes gene_type:complete
MKRLNCTVGDKRGVNGDCMEVSGTGHYVEYSVAEKRIVGLVERIAELEEESAICKNLLYEVLEAKEVLTNARNTKSVRLQLEMSGSVKHYLLERPTFTKVSTYLHKLKEQESGSQ